MERTYRSANVFYIPALILFGVFVVYPFLDGVRIAFTNWNGYSRSYSYVGLRNLARLFSDRNVRLAFGNSLIYGFGSTILQQILGLSAAVLLDKKFPGRTVARTILYLPVLVPAVTMGYMWVQLLRLDGGVNDLVQVLGGHRVLWLSDRALAVGAVVAVNTLQYMGISMVIYLAGMQAIPSVYYEAAQLDGAGPWEQFRGITIPLLYPAFATSITLNLIGGLKLFDLVWALTSGGPGYTTHSLATLIYSSYFESQLAGFASANGIMLFATILAITAMLQAGLRRTEVELS
jgi:raffinose/stachyose/melibiose transport system permease protein